MVAITTPPCQDLINPEILEPMALEMPSKLEIIMNMMGAEFHCKKRYDMAHT